MSEHMRRNRLCVTAKTSPATKISTPYMIAAARAHTQLYSEHVETTLEELSRHRRLLEPEFSLIPYQTPLLILPSALSPCPKSLPRLSVLRPRRAEDVEHARAVRARTHGVRHVAGCAPEVALLH